MEKAILIAFCILISISPTLYAVDIPVGGSIGWTTGFDYVTWSSSQNLTTNDTLVFTYGPSHSLDEVSQSDYTNCNGASPISSTSVSPTRVPLTTAGTRYFICPRSNHCQNGMKLAVTVTGGAAPPPSTPAAPRTPASPGTPAASQSPPSSPSPPPPKSAASRDCCLGVETFIAIGAVFGLMG